MIEEQVQVVAIEGDQLLLEVQTKSACGGCAAKQGCGTSVLAKVVGKKMVRFSVANTVDAQVGDEIVIGLPEDALLRGSLLIYTLPLVSMIVLALLADILLADTVPVKDLMVVAVSLFGLFSSLWFVKKYFSSSASQAEHTPVIIRKLIV